MLRLSIKFLNILFMSVFLLLMFSSCAVVKAAKKEGVSLEKVQACRSRSQFLAAGARVISSQTIDSGELVEIYQFQKEKGSAARALMHGVLDVSTFGLWEVIGTPMEVCMDEKDYFSLKVYYDFDENIKKIELV